MAETRRRNVYFTIPQDAWLESEAKRLGIGVTELLRRIVDSYRAHEEAHKQNITNNGQA